MKTWFITGTSKGFGRIWAEAALERGDQVVATARRVETLDELVEKYGDKVLPLALDVTDKAAVDAAIKQGFERFERLDIVVNNAGYGHFGAIEEATEAEVRAQFETNVFGALWVTQAALPYLRQQGSGHLLQVSSIGGVHAFPTLGLYHASKWALEAFSQSLAAEVQEFGIKVTLVEPTGFSTDWSGPSAARSEELDVYDGVRERRAAYFASIQSKPGDPEATGPVILKLVDMEEPPLRLFLGKGPFKMIQEEYAKRIAQWGEFNDLAEEAHGD
ncbi:SDR family oxidoreductase [bacterium]|nr:MAG: SDR family oxidoreductase [bacterium]